MKLLFHLTVLPPARPECEALSQEIAALREHLGGELVYLNPNQYAPVYVPRFLFGFHHLRQLRRLEAGLDLHHVYNPDAYAFPVLRQLGRPVIYSISSGVGDRRPNIAFFSRLAAVVVSDQRSLGRLRAWGLKNVFLVRSGIELSRFNYSALPLGAEFKLLVGSAPWTTRQFRTKGVEALLQAAQEDPRLRLTFLWRGVLTGEMARRVKRMKLEHQVEVIDKQVNVNQVLAGVHATVALAATPGIVKSYPHSLLDSLAAGKPVLVSRAIPMSDYVDQTACGKVVEQVDAAEVLRAIKALEQDYDQAQAVASRAGERDFAQRAMVESFETVYRTVLQRVK
jgi:glycosyltransferase involved in cell wall biosynthesis